MGHKAEEGEDYSAGKDGRARVYCAHDQSILMIIIIMIIMTTMMMMKMRSMKLMMRMIMLVIKMTVPAKMDVQEFTVHTIRAS